VRSAADACNPPPQLRPSRSPPLGTSARMCDRRPCVCAQGVGLVVAGTLLSGVVALNHSLLMGPNNQGKFNQVRRASLEDAAASGEHPQSRRVTSRDRPQSLAHRNSGDGQEHTSHAHCGAHGTRGLSLSSRNQDALWCPAYPAPSSMPPLTCSRRVLPSGRCRLCYRGKRALSSCVPEQKSTSASLASVRAWCC
jgi:hypothetical protein